MDEKLKEQSRQISNIPHFLVSAFLFFHLGLLSNTYASPEGGVVVGGSGSINQSDLQTTIRQNTQNMAIDWQSYNVQQNERVQYIQPNSRSISLNRILGNNASTIRGRIDANGQVVLVNPNGIFFSPTATINVGGLMASGLDIKPSDFMNGNYIFNEVASTDGFVINSGIINAATGGNVTLLGKQVRNDGMIVAKLGAVNMAAGKAAVVTFDNTGLLGVRITKEVLQNELGIDPAVLNSGSINAEGGRILLTGSVSRDIFSSAVNTGNIEQATSAVVHADGTFTLGGGADVVNTGTLDVSTDTVNQDAGDIVVIGDNVTSSGIIKADSEKDNGGNIELHATDTTLLTENSITSAQTSTSGVGGNIKVLGNNVGLFDNAQVNTSGANGGGEVLIGGDKTGQNKQIRNAEFIYLSENSTVKADATDNGDGGKLITFASDTARIYGNLSARGGAKGGNGGFIETSGFKGFEILKTPDIAAPQGKGGSWLIDPYNIEIVSGGGSSNIDTVTDPFTSTGGTAAVPASIGVDLLYAALDNNDATVTITTGNTPNTTDAGDINFETSFDYDRNGRRSTLVLNAANDINTNTNDVIASNRSINLVFNANADNNAAGGNVNIANSLINTNGGNFTATGVDFTLTETNFGKNIKTQGGNVSLDMTGIVTLDGNVITEGGTVTIVNSASMNTGKRLNTRGRIDTRNGSTGVGVVSINSAGLVDIGANIFTRGSNVVVTSNGFTTQAGADINTTGSEFMVGARTDGDILINSGVGDISIGARLFTNSGGNSNNGRVDLISTGNGDITMSYNLTTSGGNVTVQGGSFDNTGGGIQTQAGEQGNVAITTTGQINLNGAINTDNGSVTVNAGTIYSSDIRGNITTNNNGGGTNGTVSINAQGNLTSAGQINTNNAAVNFNNGAAITTGGSVALNGNITTNGGRVTVAKSTAYNSTGNIDAGAVAINSSGIITSGGQINSNGGNVDLISTGGSATANLINLNNNITSGGGTVTVNGGRFVSDATGSINTGRGNIAITTVGNITTGAQLTTTSGNVNLTTTATGSSVTLNSGISTSSGSLDVNTQDTILATSAPLQIGGNAMFSNVNNNIMLDNSANNFQGTVAITNGVGNVAITNSNTINFATSSTGAGTLTVNANGISQSGAITQSANGGLVTFNAGNGVIDLNNNSNGFTGNVVLTNNDANNVSVYNTGTLQLGASTLGSGSLTLNAGGLGIAQVGAIQQTGTAAGDVTLTARSGNITLQNTSNAFIGNIDFATTAGDVRLTNNADIQLSQSVGNQVAGDLVLSAVGGNSIIQQTEVGVNGLTVTGTSTFMVNAGQDIVLKNSSNNFNGVSFLANTAGMLRDVKVTNTGELDLQALSVSRDLTVTAGGAITNNAGNITVGGLATLTAVGDITLGAGTAGNNVHDFTNIVIANANNVIINDVNGINIGDTNNTQSNITGTLTLNANGNITQSAALTNAATATFNAGNANILLTNANNDFNSLNLGTTGNATIMDSNNGIQLGNIAANDLAITTTNGGNISEATGSSITVAGLTTLDSAGAIELGNGPHNFNNLVFAGTDVAINNASGINIGDGTANGTTTSTATNLTLTAQGNITDIGSTANSVTGTANLTASNGNIALLNTDFQGTLTATAANTITVDDASSLTLGTLNAANTIDLTVGGSINGGNLTAAQVKLLASSGISTTTNTASLDVQNIDQGTTTASGDVTITNTQAVDIVRLHSFTRATASANSTAVGNVNFTNTGDVTVRAGSIDSGYNEGQVAGTDPIRPVLSININNGSLFARANTTGDINNADITAYYATFNIPQGDFGWPGRQLVVNLKRGGFILANRSIFPRLTPPGPTLGLIDNSAIPLNYFDVSTALSGEQLISVEELEDINPAIFSDVRNYTYGQIAIRLPRDQLFEDELQEIELKETQGK